MRSARLGQHFLVKEAFLGRLVDQVPHSTKTVLEIGVGDGRLTGRLLNAGYEVTGYELDGDLFLVAKERIGENPRLKLVMADGFTDVEGYDAMVSSLPYYASRRFVEWFAGTSTPLGVVVLQKDFADKIGSAPGDRRYGAYSVLTSYCFRLKELFVIPPDAFVPKPKVFSSALLLERIRTLPNSRGCAIKLKSLFSYRGRLVASLVRDFKKRGLWDAAINLDDGLLHKRVEKLLPSEAMIVIRGIVSD